MVTVPIIHTLTVPVYFCIYSYVAYGATTALDASDALLVPTEFVAVTVNV